MTEQNLKPKKEYIFLHIPSCWVKIRGPIKNQLPGYPQSGLKAMSGRRREKSVSTIASYACNHHHGWRTQAAWTKTRICFHFNFSKFLCQIIPHFVALNDILLYYSLNYILWALMWPISNYR